MLRGRGGHGSRGGAKQTARALAPGFFPRALLGPGRASTSPGRAVSDLLGTSFEVIDTVICVADVGAQLLLHSVFHDELHDGHRSLGAHAVRPSNDLAV